MSLVFLFIITILPSLLIGLYIYYKDKYEKEPIHLIVNSFLFGCLAIIPSFLLEAFAEYSLEEIDIFLYTLIGIAAIEEGMKFFFLKKYLFSHKEFNEPFDGIIYAVMISLGFATIENLAYVFLYSDPSESLQVAFWRMFSAVPLHAACGVIMGYYAGEAKFEKKRQSMLLFIGLLGAITLHTFYDYFLIINKATILSFISLSIGIFYSIKAIRIHQDNSPFNTD